MTNDLITYKGRPVGLVPGWGMGIRRPFLLKKIAFEIQFTIACCCPKQCGEASTY